MDPIHTHYDNLKVSRDAPLEVIRAAFKILSQKHHPDKNPDGDTALVARRMTLINLAYDTLSDPNKRAQHDRWIQDRERLQAAGMPSSAPEQQKNTSSTKPSRGTAFTVDEDAVFRYAAQAKKPKKTKVWQWAATIVVMIVIGSLLGKVSDQAKPAVTIMPSGRSSTFDPSTAREETPSIPSGLKPFTGELDPQPPVKKRTFDRAPNGERWPASSGYVYGYPVLHIEGYSTIEIDNSGNRNAVFGKLVALDGGPPVPIRHFYISGASTLKLEKVSPGSYDLRFRNLITGNSLKAEPFLLEETETDRGVRYTTMSLTLYTVRNGNAKVTNIDDAEFDLGE